MTPQSAALLVVLIAALWLALVAWGAVEWLQGRAGSAQPPDTDCGCHDGRCRGMQGR